MLAVLEKLEAGGMTFGPDHGVAELPEMFVTGVNKLNNEYV